MTLISRDGLGVVQAHLSQLITERWGRLTDCVRTQLLWLIREMIRNGVNGVDTLCWNLMRHMAGGDVTQKNIVLIESVLDILVENRYVQPFLYIRKHVFFFIKCRGIYLCMCS